MAQSLADVIIHLIFSTKERNPWIQPDVEEELYQYIGGVCRNHDSPVIKINGVEDHVHVLLQLGKTIPISKLVSEMKSSSSRWIKTRLATYEGAVIFEVIFSLEARTSSSENEGAILKNITPSFLRASRGKEFESDPFIGSKSGFKDERGLNEAGAESNRIP